MFYVSTVIVWFTVYACLCRMVSRYAWWKTQKKTWRRQKSAFNKTWNIGFLYLSAQCLVWQRWAPTILDIQIITKTQPMIVTLEGTGLRWFTQKNRFSLDPRMTLAIPGFYLLQYPPRFRAISVWKSIGNLNQFSKPWTISSTTMQSIPMSANNHDVNSMNVQKQSKDLPLASAIRNPQPSGPACWWVLRISALAVLASKLQ